MNKPQNWDTMPAESGVGERPIGPHICVIKDCSETKSKQGNEMVVYFLDIAEGPLKGFFGRMAKPDKGWPARFFRVISDENMPRFKGDIKAIEESNGGYVFNFDVGTLIGKKVGCNFREEEYIGSDGNMHTSTKPAYLFPLKDLDKQRVMKIKTLSKGTGNEPPPPADDDLPFGFGGK